MFPTENFRALERDTERYKSLIEQPPLGARDAARVDESVSVLHQLQQSLTAAVWCCLVGNTDRLLCYLAYAENFVS